MLKQVPQPTSLIHVDHALMSQHDTVHDRQTQTCAHANRLGGEKGLEQVRQRGRVHATTVVAHPQMGPAASTETDATAAGLSAAKPSPTRPGRPLSA